MCTLRFPEIAFVELAQNEEGFIDNTRNVGVVLGEKDIKQDVKGIKTRWVQFSWNSETKNFAIHRSRFATNALDIENDHEALSQRGAQMMRTGDLRSALGLLNKAVEVFSRLQAERG